MKKSASPRLNVKNEQNCYRAEAVRFFEWCRFNLHPHLEKQDPIDKRAFESGKLSQAVFDTIKSVWSENLKTHLPWGERSTVIKNVLPKQDDYDLWMNCPMGRLDKLPKRIQTAVANGEEKRAQEIHDSFFANNGEARLKDYLKVWQSGIVARHKLMIQVTGRKLNDKGHLDTEQYFLDLVASKGTAAIQSLRYFLGGVEGVSLKNNRDITYDETLMPNVVLLPDKDGLWASEDRLNSFLKKLGRILSARKKHGKSLYEPDWLHGVDQTVRFVAEGWCQNITMDGERWPMLCFLTTPTLVRFLQLCNVKHCKLGRKGIRTIEREIQRLGLIRIPRYRIKYVEKRGGNFYFS